MGDNDTDGGGPDDDSSAGELPAEAASRRRSREDLKELVLNAGVEVLERDGLGLSVDSLTYAKVFAYIEEQHGITVSRASVHERIWDSRDEFRNAVLARAMTFSAAPVLDPVTESMNDLVEGFDQHSPQGRGRVLRDLLRLGLELNQQLTMRSPAARRQIAVKAMCLTQAEPDLVDRLRAVLRDQELARRDDFLARFRTAVDAFHLKVNPALEVTTDEALCLIESQVGRLAAGTMLDADLIEDAPPQLTVSWSDGTSEEWTPLMLGVYAIISFVFHHDGGESSEADDKGGGGP